jgi:hypothetical protein
MFRGIRQVVDKAVRSITVTSTLDNANPHTCRPTLLLPTLSAHPHADELHVPSGLPSSGSRRMYLIYKSLQASVNWAIRFSSWTGVRSFTSVP